HDSVGRQSSPGTPNAFGWEGAWEEEAPSRVPSWRSVNVPDDRIMAGQNHLYEACRRLCVAGIAERTPDEIGFMILSCHDSVGPQPSSSPPGPRTLLGQAYRMARWWMCRNDRIM